MKPPNETKIWRYMDFTKFMSLLQFQKLFFTTTRLLDDKFDGSLANVGVVGIAVFGMPDLSVENIQQSLLYPPSGMAISCWHMNEGESAAMWKAYAFNSGGVAIQSDVSRLESAGNYSEVKVVQGKVNYGLKDLGVGFNHVSPFFYKRSSFAYEQEYRVLVYVGEDHVKREKLQREGGLFIPMKLEVLIEKIYIAPFSPPWFSHLVKNVIRKYGLNKPVVLSEIDQKPFPKNPFPHHLLPKEDR